ncbi:hypothetical protein LQ567_06475 [Niabella pedocola]|uniref:Uncharacterized protein n=1 Tax=Niabella pedocola TaxID=1752077 RepID=A0ABS8PN00_9BACT|nr:DUF6624 domain-containing protein [Niabella pedocola]MCD2422401.1 hypothetical protein [Niabella pedocola]
MKTSASMLHLLTAFPFLWSATTTCVPVKPEKQHPSIVPASMMSQLAAIDYEDQRYRQEIMPVINAAQVDSAQLKAIFKKIHRADSINLATIAQILDHKGWPNPKEVGIEGSVTVWAVLQHAALQTQEKYLGMVIQAVKDHKLEPKYLGYLEDRIATDKGLKQKYGTQQFLISKDKTILAPLLDPDKVDLWRKEIGMEPLRDHLKVSIDTGWTWARYIRDLPESEGILKKKKAFFDAQQKEHP